MLWSSIAHAPFVLGLVSSAIAQGTALIARASTPSTPKPISVAPSQYWFVSPQRAIAYGHVLTVAREGNDGPWSSFTLRVGTPAQDVRVLISTSSQVSWIVLEGEGCVAGDGTCATARGGLFNRNTSSTWNPSGFWQLGNERNLGIFANGLYGNDTIGLGFQGSGGPTLQNQILATIGTQQFYLGMFAVNPKRTNHTGVTEQGQASYMTTLQQQNLIPSVSFGYTAGAPYRMLLALRGFRINAHDTAGLKKVLGSLTLGGFDQSRFSPTNLSFSFAPDNDRDIVVGIQSIVSKDQDGTSHDLLATGVNAYIDSTVPHIWLPLEACKAFEEAFGLTYDAENEIYPVTNALHEKLVAQNASITFTLGNFDSGGETVDIVLPYDSFDLQAQPPYTANATKYFPLRRAANKTQYTLGRTFLQEAYLTVDWERGNFSVSQCMFDPGMTQEKLIAIKSINATSISQHQGKSSAGKTIGIGVGVSVPIVLLAGAVAAFIVLRKRKRIREVARPTTKEQDDEAERIRQGFAKAELDASVENAKYELGEGDKLGNRVHEAWVDEKARHPGFHAELIGDGSRPELIGSGNTASELSSRERLRGPYHEMFDPSIPAVELPANMPQELPASPLRTFSRSSNSAQSFRSANMSPVRSSNETLPLNQPSGRRNAVNHGPARSPASSVSRVQPSQSQTPILSPSAQASRAPSSQGSSGPYSPREQEPFSPISPIDSTSHQGLFSLGESLAEPPEPTGPPKNSSTRYGHKKASSRKGT
ncbi:MAG: hypothetical protein Q9184_001036 [Pyrenodesmia sp. 2 TL-2023]